jgi:hypothetical protein
MVTSIPWLEPVFESVPEYNILDLYGRLQPMTLISCPICAGPVELVGDHPGCLIGHTFDLAELQDRLGEAAEMAPADQELGAGGAHPARPGQHPREPVGGDRHHVHLVQHRRSTRPLVTGESRRRL